MATVKAVPTPLPEHLPERGRVQILPLGTLKPVDHRGPWRVTDPAAIIAASQARLQRGMPVDLDHAIDRKQPAPAAGWIKALSYDAEGIWAEIEWTPMGKALLDGREYRFISPAMITSHDGTVLRIDGAGLTNNPALQMKALCASEESSQMDDQDQSQLRELAEFASNLRRTFGLPDDASLSEILIAANRKPRNEVAPVTGEPPVVEQLASAMFSGWAERRSDEIERRVLAATQEGRLPPGLQGWARKVCASNTALFDEFIRDAPSLAYLFERQIVGSPPSGKAHADNPVFAQLGLPTS